MLRTRELFCCSHVHFFFSLSVLSYSFRWKHHPIFVTWSFKLLVFANPGNIGSGCVEQNPIHSSCSASEISLRGWTKCSQFELLSLWLRGCTKHSYQPRPNKPPDLISHRLGISETKIRFYGVLRHRVHWFLKIKSRYSKFSAPRDLFISQFRNHLANPLYQTQRRTSDFPDKRVPF
jgi:hypothetical protein